jgi:hypothetical protein
MYDESRFGTRIALVASLVLSVKDHPMLNKLTLLGFIVVAIMATTISVQWALMRTERYGQDGT